MITDAGPSPGMPGIETLTAPGWHELLQVILMKCCQRVQITHLVIFGQRYGFVAGPGHTFRSLENYSHHRNSASCNLILKTSEVQVLEESTDVPLWLAQKLLMGQCQRSTFHSQEFSSAPPLHKARSKALF